MKGMVRISVMLFAAQACLAGAALAGPAMAVRPVAVSASVAELSGAAEAISAAVAGGEDRKAERLISDLFSGGTKFQKAVPVYAEKAAPEPKAEKAEDKEPVPAWVPAPPAPVSHNISDPAAAAAAAEEERAEALKLKGFAWGVTMMTVALIFLIILL